MDCWLLWWHRRITISLPGLPNPQNRRLIFRKSVRLQTRSRQRSYVRPNNQAPEPSRTTSRRRPSIPSLVIHLERHFVPARPLLLAENQTSTPKTPRQPSGQNFLDTCCMNCFASSTSSPGPATPPPVLGPPLLPSPMLPSAPSSPKNLMNR